MLHSGMVERAEFLGRGLGHLGSVLFLCKGNLKTELTLIILKILEICQEFLKIFLDFWKCFNFSPFPFYFTEGPRILRLRPVVCKTWFCLSHHWFDIILVPSMANPSEGVSNHSKDLATKSCSCSKADAVLEIYCSFFITKIVSGVIITLTLASRQK